jgi:hypothetical protein
MTPTVPKKIACMIQTIRKLQHDLGMTLRQIKSVQAARLWLAAERCAVASPS